jgi:tRNA dimethylallyltransferase
MDKPLVVVVLGPTASGKTALGIDIAEKFGGEIVSADSMQIYENMDIATAKPTEQELSRVKHHLIGFVPMGEPFSVAKYKEKATQAIDDILSRGKLPIVVGGTGFYIDTLVKNTEFFDYEESDIRVKLEERLENEGIDTLYHELSEIDPDTAERLHINDTKRIIRALEVYHLTGKTISEQDMESHRNESKYRWCLIGLNAQDRQYLYDRINKRVDIMLDMGLIEETEKFFSSEVSATAAQAIGYKELKPYIDGFVTLEEAVEKLKMESRRYAKRQLTWFRRNPMIHWLNIDEGSYDELLSKAYGIINEER